MKEKFSDIFESINSLHKKYSSQEYLKTLDNFNNTSKDLVRTLEKYKIHTKE